MKPYFIKEHEIASEDYERIDIPTLDLRGINSDKREDHERIAMDLFGTSNEYGIVALKNHGVSMDKIKSLYEAGDQFFDLPEEVKLKYEHSIDKLHGYLRQCWNMDGEYVLMHECYDVLTMKGTFPEEVPDLKERFFEPYEQLSKLLIRISKILDVAFESDFFQNVVVNEDVNVEPLLLKLLRYPKVRSQVPIGSIRNVEHSDFGLFTILQTMEGLQIQDDNGKWKMANIPPDALLMQYGLSLQRLSSDRLHAPKHRVVVTEQEKIFQYPRYALVCFQALHSDTLLKPLDGSNKYPPITFREFVLPYLKAYRGFKE